MKYHKTVNLKNGSTCCLRNGVYADGAAVLEVFNKTHEETDFLLTYAEENSFDEAWEAEFLEKKMKNPREIELVALMDGRIVGTAGIDAVGNQYKIKHRAELGISILQEFCGLGIGQALMNACIECAKEAGYLQLELSVVAENTGAISLYKKLGFVEYGRNPKGFLSKTKGFQDLVDMRLEL